MPGGAGGPAAGRRRQGDAIKGVVIAGTHSGSGKTTIALGLMAALRARGMRVAPFKVGPDFIDPGHHLRAAGAASRNLDGWMLSPDYNRRCFYRHATGADAAVVEGVMGLYDGSDGRSESGSTAQMAKWLNLPVVLVVDARSMARSAAALVQGFENFDPHLAFAGVVFNNLGSERHLRYLTDALQGNVRMPCLGGVPRTEAIAIPERHLGLVVPDDHALSDADLARLAGLVEAHLDLPMLLDRCGLAEVPPETEAATPGRAPVVRIGVARDNAFCFYYPDNLDLLESAGAELVYFSPLTDAVAPEDLDGLYLGGGYPELHAARLSDNRDLRRRIRAFSRQGMPIYGECGGMMYLGEAVTDGDGRRYPMCGCFPLETRMLPRLKALGYREIRLQDRTVLGSAGQTLRGHEFHYSEIQRIDEGVDTVYRVTARGSDDGAAEGFRIGNTLGSYIHLHFGSRTAAADAFVQQCLAFRRKRVAVR